MATRNAADYQITEIQRHTAGMGEPAPPDPRHLLSPVAISLVIASMSIAWFPSAESLGHFQFQWVGVR